VIVSWCTRPPEEEQWEPFLWRPSLLRAPEEERPWWQNRFLWFGLFAATWFTLYFMFW
jgi:hypothetical protein